MLLIHAAEKEITGEVVQNFINFHKAELPRYKRLKNLYESKSPILEQDPKPDFKPDHRLVNNFSRKITMDFNGYFIGKPVKITHPNKSIGERVNDFLSINDMEDNMAETAKLSSIYGHCFQILYQDEDSRTCSTYNSPMDMFIVYDDTIQQNPLFAVRYMETQDNGIRGQLFTAYEEYSIVQGKDSLILTDGKPHYYGDVPVIEFIENEERQGIYESVESLITVFDSVLSEKANDVSYFADAYLLLLGMELDEKTIEGIRNNRIINMYGKEGAEKLLAQFLDKPDADGTQENMLDRLERLIYELSNVANINSDSFGNASGVALEFKLQPMKNLAAMKERKYTSGMNRMFKMLFNLVTNFPANQKDEWRNLQYSFFRNLPRNITDEVNAAKAMTGITSKKTQLSSLSVVDNVEDELEQIKKEREEEYQESNTFQSEMNTPFGNELNGKE